MSNSMSRTQREQFLAEPHVGVISIATDRHGSTGVLSVPIWYDYDPEIGLWVLTEPTSIKAAALDAAGRFTLVAQNEALPYQYVSVEGPVAQVRPFDFDEDLLPMSIRYLGAEQGAAYAAATADTPSNVYLMQPERWWTSDLTNALATLG